ncbi:general transcription factor 3C polypeptide 1-like [Mytilus trossulus]|uniref:general transcription factor 3C polypeptide 1-like n=1 Tax=Mytilus trossulus TaxID=6551 RepID=UPI003005F60D
MDLNYLTAVVDEIALEGLEGITVNTLWKRLAKRPGFVIKLDEKSKAFLWRQLTTVSEFVYYELPEPRPDLDIFNRMDFVDPESGHMVELNQDTHHTEAYPVTCINQDGVIGSCSTFHTRYSVTDEIVSDGKLLMSLEKVIERFGEKLVVVASQRQRNEALLGKTFDPTYSWIDSTYCVLERIGRGRYSGELSAGPVSLEVFKMPSKTLFYHTIKLVRLGIIKKQDVSVLSKSHKHLMRKMFHLTRFFKVVNSKNFIIASQIATYLLEKPNHREIISKTRNDLHIEEKSFKKVYKTYKKVFKTYLILYREMFPDAKEREYMTKNKISEKHLRVIECTRMPSSASDEESDDEVGEEDEETEGEDTKRELKPYAYIYERPLLCQGLMAVESAGPQGVNRAELTKMMCLDYYDGRAICKALIRSGSVVDVVVDMGKVKRIQYIAKKFKDESNVLQEYYSEQGKFLELIKKEEPEDEYGEARIHDTAEISQDELPGNQSMSTEMLTSIPIIKQEIIMDESTDNIESIMEGINSSSQEISEVSMGSSFLDDVSEFPHIKSEQDMYGSPNVRRKFQKKESIQTGKHFKRMSWLLEAIRDAKLIENVFHLIKNLRAKEKAEGSSFQIDKKTLNTLLHILVKQGKVRCIKTIIGTGDNTKLLQFYCDPSIQPTDNIVKSAIEQAKLKSFSVSKESLKNSHKKKTPVAKKPCKDLLEGLPDSARESICKLHEFKSKLKSTDMIYDKKAARLYGYKAKMQRGRIIQQLLWYLVYGYQGKVPDEEVTTQEDSSQEESSGDISAKGKSKIPPVHVNEMTWKRYLAPLPEHRGYPKGWCLISDVLLSLPLCLFCALVHVSYKIDGLMEWLNDPVKCLYPISFLPCKISQRLLFARKYIFAFHENCQRLCHMGLLSFGSSNNKEKDQIFIYLHQYASLVDTRASYQGYFKTRMPPGHQLEMKTYHFDSIEAVEQYWIDLKHFALSSNLGHKLLTDKDKEDKTEAENVFLSLEQSQSPKSPADIIDDGIIPGDGRGPAGLDSSLYVHLGRNWSWGNLQPKPKTSAFTDSLHGVEESQKTESEKAMAMFEERKQMTISSSPPRSKPQPKERITLIGGKKGATAEVVQVKVAKTKGNKGGKGIKRKLQSDDNPAKKKLVKLKSTKKGKRGKKPNLWQDEKDRAALEVKTSMRVHWSSKEDGLLLTCKIASLVMDKNSRGMIIPWVIVRDILYRYAPEESVDKSSLACQRRVAHSLKNPIVKQNLSIFYAESIQDPKVKSYMNIKYTQGSDETIRVYKEVVDVLIKKFASADVKECALPETVDSLKKFTISVVNPCLKTVVFSDPSNKSDILSSVLRNIFHSFVSLNDKQGRSHEMYQLLSQYPDKLLEQTLNKMRGNGLIVRIKKNADAKVIDTGVQGVKLSQKYTYRFQSRFPSIIFEESVECLNQLMAFQKAAGPTGKLEINDLSKGGYCACYIGLYALGKLVFQTRIPRDIVILDPSLKQHFNRGLYPVEDTDDETELGEDMSDSSSITESLISKRKAGTDKKGGTSIGNVKAVDLISRCSIGKQSIMEYEEAEKREITTERSSQASRALITMKRSRDEGAHKLKVYNVQDNFVINRCLLRIGLDVSGDRSDQECRLEHIPVEEANKSPDLPIISPSSISHGRQRKKLKTKKPEVDTGYPDLTLSKSKVSEVLKRLTRTLPFQLDIDLEWESFDPLHRQNLKQVYETVDKNDEIGITVYDLKKEFNYSDLLSPCLKCLEERNMVVKVGVTCTRYVTLRNVRPWAVHSYKNSRGRGGDTQAGRDPSDSHIDNEPPSDPLDAGPSGDVNMIDGDSLETNHTKGDNSSQHSIAEDHSSSQTHSNDLTSPKENTSSQRPRRSLTRKPESSYPKPVSTYDRIRLILKPWKKPEGLLNKPVFKMMIESVMLYVMMFSGVHFNAICEKYTPYLQPFCIRELMDVLEDLNCVEKTVFRKPVKSSLFSKPAVTQEALEEHYEDDEIFYEGTADCVVKLGQFMDKIQNQNIGCS